MPSSKGPLSRLKKDQGQLLLHLEGTPFEMGFQHGSSLKETITQNIEKYLKNKNKPQFPEQEERLSLFFKAIPNILPHIPQKYIEEMEGIAKGSNQSFQDILLLNLFPEMFHCCGITASEKATEDGSLYHVRVLDYSIGKNLQSSAVLIFAKPKEGISFINITYAGFIGSVTGMNEEKISIGEIGGKGYGKWDGIPMSFLLRSILEEAHTLQQAKEILTNSKRTCEYYYIIADGKTEDSFACYATSSQIQFLSPGEPYSIAPGDSPLKDLLFQKGLNKSTDSLSCFQPPNTILLTGLSYPERYPILLDKVKKQYGKINAFSLMDIIRRPVSLESNLHNAIFHPASRTVWITHADPEGHPACDQPYSCFTWDKLSSISSSRALG